MNHYGSILSQGSSQSALDSTLVPRPKPTIAQFIKSCFCLASDPIPDRLSAPIPLKKTKKQLESSETHELEQQMQLHEKKFQLVGKHNQVILYLQKRQLNQSQTQYTTQDSMCQYLQRKKYLNGNVCVFQLRPCQKLASAVLEWSELSVVSMEQNEGLDLLQSSQKSQFLYEQNRNSKIAEIMVSKNHQLRCTGLFDRIIVCPYMKSTTFEYHIEQKKILKFVTQHLNSVDSFEKLVIILPSTFCYQSVIKMVEREDRLFQEKYQSTFSETHFKRFAKYAKCTGLYLDGRLEYTLVKFKLVKQAITYRKLQWYLSRRIFFHERVSQKLEQLLDLASQNNITLCVRQLSQGYFTQDLLKNKLFYHQYLNILINAGVVRSGDDLHLLQSVFFQELKIPPIDIQFQIVVPEKNYSVNKGSADIEGFSFSYSEKQSHDLFHGDLEDSSDKTGSLFFFRHKSRQNE